MLMLLTPLSGSALLSKDARNETFAARRHKRVLAGHGQQLVARRPPDQACKPVVRATYQ
jgi:hypothetical protein